MTTEKISNKTLRQKVYEQLRAKLERAEILPGEIITLGEIADKFGVSPLPVREAVRQLESEKILFVGSHKRIQVNELSSKEFEEILSLRLVLESMAVEMACQKRPENAVPKMCQILQGMKRNANKRPKTYFRKNTEFHLTLYSYSDFPLLVETIERIIARVLPYVYLYAATQRDHNSAVKCHREMYEGFAERDVEKAKNAVSRDLEDAARVIIPRLK